MGLHPAGQLARTDGEGRVWLWRVLARNRDHQLQATARGLRGGAGCARTQRATLIEV